MTLHLGRPAMSSFASLDDESADIEAAVARIHHGDAQALFGFVRRLGLTDDQADDAVQEVFARLLAEYGRNVAIVNPRAWAFRAVYRLAMDEHRLRRRLTALARRLERAERSKPVDDADRVAVWGEVDRLPRRQRQVIYLRYRGDLSYEEIAQVLGITPSAARSHSTQAVATLRRTLAIDVQELDGP